MRNKVRPKSIFGRYSSALFIFVASAESFAQTSGYATRPRAVVPFVGCVSEGMSGHVDAPSGDPLRLALLSRDAARLAYFVVEPGLATLAPRGWHCVNIYGSSGADVLITPQLMDVNTAVETIQNKHSDGPAVALTYSSGFTSGREEVASVVSRVFPAHRSLIRNAAANNETKPVFPGPFATDRLKYISQESLEFVTPAGKMGIGTLLAPLHPASQPISGVQILVRNRGDCCDLISLSIRLPSADSDLVPLLIRQEQRESKKHR